MLLLHLKIGQDFYMVDRNNEVVARVEVTFKNKSGMTLAIETKKEQHLAWRGEVLRRSVPNGQLKWVGE